MLSVEKCNDSIYQWKTGTLIHESGLLLSLHASERGFPSPFSPARGMRPLEGAAWRPAMVPRDPCPGGDPMEQWPGWVSSPA